MEMYESRIVLFLDILGFQKIIDDTVTKGMEQTEKLKKLIETLKEMKRTVSLMPKKTSKVVTQFSDSIVLSFKEDDFQELFNVFSNIQRLICATVKSGLLCRGAIAYGKLYHDEHFVLGPALVEAYQTESEAAIYPRVILDKSVLDIMKSNFSLNNSHRFRGVRFDGNVNSCLRPDSDDKYFIDYFIAGAFCYEEKLLEEYFDQLRKTIVNGLKFKSPGVKRSTGG